MGVYVVIKPDGTETRVEGDKKIDIHKLYELIGCRSVEITQIRYEGRKRDCWLDEEGLLKETIQFNHKVRRLSAAYWGCPIERVQAFAGTGVVWLPNG